MIFAFIVATAVVPVVPVSADSVGIWQVNGKYALTKKKLVTYCTLNGADSNLKRKRELLRLHLLQNLFM